MIAADWGRILLPNEKVKWVGESHFRHLGHGLTLAAVLSLSMTAWLLYFAIHYHSLAEACGPYPSTSCWKMFYLAWPGAGLMFFMFLVTLYHAIAQALGIMHRSYAITNKRVLSLLLAPHLQAEGKLTQFESTGLTIKYGASSLSFRSSNKPVLTFVGLAYAEVLQAREAFNLAKSEKP